LLNENPLIGLESEIECPLVTCYKKQRKIEVAMKLKKDQERETIATKNETFIRRQTGDSLTNFSAVSTNNLILPIFLF
jgi:hypothetical protein